MALCLFPMFLLGSHVSLGRKVGCAALTSIIDERCEAHSEEAVELGLEPGGGNSICKDPEARGGLMGSPTSRRPVWLKWSGQKGGS